MHWYLLGSCLLYAIPAWSQPKTVETYIEAQTSVIENTYYYDNLDSALYHYQRLSTLAKEHALPYQQLNVVINATWCALYHDALDTLQHFLQKAESIANRHQQALDSSDSDYSLRANIQYNWGYFYDMTGDRLSAIKAYQTIASNPKVQSDSFLLSDTYYSLGLSYHQMSNYSSAIDNFQQARQWLPSDNPNVPFLYKQALFDLALGSSYTHLGLQKKQTALLQTARAFFLQSLVALQQPQPLARTANATISSYQLLAQWHLEEKNYDSALWYIDQSNPLYEADNPRIIDAHILIGDILVQKADYQEALRHYQTALSIAQEKYPHKHEKKAEVWLSFAKLYQHQQAWDQALIYAQQALVEEVDTFHDLNINTNPVTNAQAHHKSLLETVALKAKLLTHKHISVPQDTSSLLLALNTYHLAIGVADQMRQVFPSLEYKQFLSAKSAALYEQAIGTAYRAHTLGLQQRDFLAEAFFFSEKSKAATLLEATKTAEARTFAGIPDTLLAQENKLKRELTFWENKLYQATDDSTKRVVRHQTFQTREAYHTLIKHLEQDYPDYFRLKYSTEVIGLRALQATLSPGTTLLSFSYGDSSLYIFSINREAVQLHTQQIDRSFNQSLDNMLQYISRYTYEQAGNLARYQAFVQDAHHLYQTLVQPSLPPRTPQQLIIIPDGRLGYLPFDVLLTDTIAEDAIRFQHLPYLIRQFPIRYEYSATLLTTSPPPLDQPMAYLGFAPTYDEPTAAPAPVASSREVRATLDGQIIGLSPLRYNQAEVDYVADLFKGKIFAGKEASEQHFKEHASEANLLHLSMHAYAHDENDDLSGLIFTQQTNASRTDTTQEDNFLHPNELYSLSLHAELAVLSACETGMGTLAKGEGIMSLGRAFKYAGCPNVTMSLWRADDQSTSHLMQSFFTYLQAGRPKDEALRQAKLAYLDEAKSVQAHPYYWAAFVQVGDDVPLLGNHDSERYYWLGGAVFLMLIGVLFWIYRRRFV